ncbi:nucleoside triphosphate pyrophosphatase [Enterovirga sp.]|uniref:Maf family protein n=1 Tax=Enterovirga sp. TaxID=2026350 RepID=UPI002CC6F531|nr:nucleoside triphosphate pyrophosphatase [Enterovirga sp.]HMO30443.1 nucleoside triphosphate pyrophosphatase [Enterovirga sp.]
MDGPWRSERPVLLASTSATRRRLLAGAGLPVEPEDPGVDERALQASLGLTEPRALVRALAEAKALSVSARHPDRFVIGADQVLVCEGEIMNRPEDEAAARRHLAWLQGRSHSLHVGVAIARSGLVEEEFCESARLAMRPLDEHAIARYVDLVGPAATRSVGAYEIESLGIHLFQEIEGEHTTILGLPLLPLLAALRRLGVLEL